MKRKPNTAFIFDGLTLLVFHSLKNCQMKKSSTLQCGGAYASYIQVYIRLLWPGENLLIITLAFHTHYTHFVGFVMRWLIYTWSLLKEILANRADPNQVLQNEISDQGLHCLHTQFLYFLQKEYSKRCKAVFKRKSTI